MVNKIRCKAKELLEDTRGSHDWEHTMRVERLARHIAKIESADLEIITLAAYLHDVGRMYEDRSHGKICHAEKSAKIARDLLTKENLSSGKIEQVLHCIKAHRFRGKIQPETKEAKVLFDADKLDSIGAVGIGRAFQFAAEIGAKLHNPDVEIEKTESYSKEDTAYREFMVKLRKIKSRMLTTEGRRLAKERHKFMVAFFERLNQEVKGKL